MPAPGIYLHFPGTARTALHAYREIFGGELELHTYADFGRVDGPGEAIAHGGLRGPVDLFGADAAPGEPSVRTEGVMLALLGAADPETLRGWFSALAEDGEVLDDLQRRAWGDWDGQVRDRFGLTWLIGFQPDDDGVAA